VNNEPKELQIGVIYPSQESSFPRLSKDLPGKRGVWCCQSCNRNAIEIKGDLERWMECNDQDEETGVVVVLCPQCSDQLIEPHPTLYRQMSGMEPHPGSMHICDKCVHRRKLNCSLTRLMGGPGLLLRFPEPQVVHVKSSKPGQSGFRKLYRGPVKCDQRQEVARNAFKEDQA